MNEKLPESLNPLLESLRHHSLNSNGFITLYPNFLRHETPEGWIARVDAPGTWVGAAEPVGEERHHSAILRSFADAAAREGKSALILPVTARTAETAKRLGWGSLEIGSEPIFDFTQWPPTGRTWIDMVPTAKQLHHKGATVREFRPENLDDGTRRELDLILREWLDSRKMNELGFLNQVQPWRYAERKKYFRIDFEGRPQAFLACIPIGNEEGWYLIDMPRRNGSPPGTTELLVIQAMRRLHENGAKFATLGMAPLSDLRNDPAHPRLIPLLRLNFRHGNVFYNFQPLHEFKAKFEPTRWTRLHLIYHHRRQPRDRLTAGQALDLFRVMQPEGLLSSARGGVLRLARRLSPATWIRSLVAPSVVVRSAPQTLSRLLLRARFTLLMLILNSFWFVMTTPDLLERWHWSRTAFRNNPFQALALSPFLHQDPPHLFSNLGAIALFTGGLEYLTGSRFAAWCFLLPAWLANPLTDVLLTLVGLSGSPDVGASTGFFGTIGALSLFLRHGKWLFLLSAAGSLISIGWTHNLQSLNHCIALLLGYLMARIKLRSGSFFHFR